MTTDFPDFQCPYAETGQARCPAWRCDCFVDTHPEDPMGLHPEDFCVHMPQLDGSCRISVAGQGHLPCSIHDANAEPTKQVYVDSAVRTVRRATGRPVETRNLLDE